MVLQMLKRREVLGGWGGGAKSAVVNCFAIRDLRELIVVIDSDTCIWPEGGALG